MRLPAAALLVLAACHPRDPAPLPAGPTLDLTGAWTAAQTQPLVDKTQRVTLAPDLSHLTDGERAAVAKLREVGEIFQQLYEDQRHRQAGDARAALAGSDREDLRTLYDLFQGPIATDLDNQRVAFLPVDDLQPGKTVYPWKIEKAELDAFLDAHPDARADLLAPRTVVRRGADVAAELAALDRHPVLDTLHPGLRARLGSPAALVAVPYSVAYADALVRAQGLLFDAADLVDADDAELAGYLRNRGRDLLSDDYESGDAAWVTASFRHLNAQLGAYEQYDDELYGAKTFFACSLLARRQDESDALASALAGLQALEDALPYDRHKHVREHIPVGVYDVIADYGQARGGNTATILPNEAYLAQRYGRTILLRGNIMRNPSLFSRSAGVWQAAVAPAHHAELTADGSFQRTLWHEVGHYLGVDTTADGRTLDAALEDDASLLEEMKADLVSLFVAEPLHASGYHSDAELRAIYASGVLRVLQNNKPRRDQPYNTMQLMQWNFFLEQKLLTFADGVLAIDYTRYHDVVGKLLAQVLAIQSAGDKAAADAFIATYTTWDDALHGVIAAQIRAQQPYRYTLFDYAVSAD